MAAISTGRFYGRRNVPTEDSSDGDSDVAEDNASNLSDADYQLSDHDTDSEIDMNLDPRSSSDDDESAEDNDFLIGKNGCKWAKHAARQHRAHQHNVIREREGPMPDVANSVDSIVDCIHLFIT